MEKAENPLLTFRLGENLNSFFPERTCSPAAPEGTTFFGRLDFNSVGTKEFFFSSHSPYLHQKDVSLTLGHLSFYIVAKRGFYIEVNLGKRYLGKSDLLHFVTRRVKAKKYPGDLKVILYSSISKTTS